MTIHTLPCISSLGSIEIAIAPAEYVPVEIDAIVEEQDTQLLMSVDAEIQYPEEDFDTLIKEMAKGKARAPGQIIVKRGNPIRFQAIIHDIYQKPSWKVEWIAFALKQLVEKIEVFDVKTLAMPLLGTVYGNMDEEESIKLLCSMLATDKSICLNKFWLIAPDPACNRLKNAIDKST